MRKSSGALLLEGALSLASLGATSDARAFCRTSSCGPKGGPAITGQTCTPAAAGDCGIPLFWPSACVGYSIQKDASKQISFAVAEATFKQAFASWTSAACDKGGTPRIEVTELDPVTCDKHEYNQTAGNANAIMFRDDKWPYEGSGNTLALTTVTYNLENGEIYDADMELNTTSDVQFTTGDKSVQSDLLSVVTHETGHFLGLAHSLSHDATMFSTYSPGATGLRDLSPDDRTGICTIYPPGDIPASCDPTPRHCFSTLCASEQPHQDPSATCAATPTPTPAAGCCAVAPGAGPSAGTPVGAPAGAPAPVAAALGALLFAARRRRRALPRS